MATSNRVPSRWVGVTTGVVIELRTQAPTARLVADRRALQAFLAAAASLVPPGTEIDHYTLDEELLRIQHG